MFGSLTGTEKCGGAEQKPPWLKSRILEQRSRNLCVARVECCAKHEIRSGIRVHWNGAQPFTGGRAASALATLSPTYGSSGLLFWGGHQHVTSHRD